MTTNEPHTTRLTKPLKRMLGRLRWRIRGYVALHGLAVTAVVLGAAFWVSLAVDWLFEPPRGVRGAFLIAVSAAAGAVLFWLVLRRLIAPLANRSLALLLERKFADFHDSLVTAVELAERQDLPGASREMFEHTRRLAERRAVDVPLGDVFNTAPLTRGLVGAAVLAMAVAVFAFALPEMFGVWSRRNLELSEELWPRRTALAVDGFGSDGLVKVARGGDVPLLVRADAAKLVPRVVQVRYQTDEGARGRANMTREGAAVPGRDVHQVFAYTFEGVLSSREFDVVGGDDRIRGLRIQVVDSPTVGEIALDCQFPAYTGRSPRTLPVSGAVELPRGTRVAIRARASKPLEWVDVGYTRADGASVVERVEPRPVADESPAAARREFDFVIESLENDTTLLLTLHDVDGVHNRDPVRLALRAVPDEPPVVAVRLVDIGSAVTPVARLPMTGRVTDDYGLAQGWFDYVIDDGAPSRQIVFDELAAAPNSAAGGLPIEKTIDTALDVRDLALAPGQKLLLGLKAVDGYALGSAPNEGAGERYLVDVVTPDELRRLLESRELNLRRRFEAIVAEMTDTRDSLRRIRPAPQAADEAPADELPAGAEPEDESRAAAEPAPEAADELRRLRAQRARQNGRKSREETRGVAESFARIRAELENNRIDAEEWKDRIQAGVVEPLERIVDERFPALDEKLARLAAELADKQEGAAAPDEAARDEALRAAELEADALLVELQQVLSRMLELESLNEAIDLLRDIIAAQEKVNEETQQRRLEKARELLQ